MNAPTSRHRGLRAAAGAGFLLCLAVAFAPARAAAYQEVPKLDLASFRGKVVYLDFWASWCPPCVQSFPFLEALAQEHQERGLVVIGVNVDTDRALAERFLSRHAVGFRVLFDPAGALAEQWRLEAMPMAFLIGRDGTVRVRHPGFRSSDRRQLEEQVNQLLAEEAP